MQRPVRPNPTTPDRAFLNLGCGPVWHPDWTNLDAAPCAPEVERFVFEEALPFSACLFRIVYHSHFLEHLDRNTASRLLRECLRVLVPGGVLRVVVPDLEYNARLYLQALAAAASDRSAEAAERHEWALLNLIDQFARSRSGGEILPFLRRELRDPDFVRDTTAGEAVDTFRLERSRPTPGAAGGSTWTAAMGWLRRLRGAMIERVMRVDSLLLERILFLCHTGERHLWAYDEHSLTTALLGAGFTSVQRQPLTHSHFPDWSRFSLDCDEQGRERKPHSLCVEAFKPNSVAT